MGKLIDLTDRTFDMLTVIKRVEDRKPGRPMWVCQCECGNTVVVSSTICYEPMVQNHAAVFGILPLPPSLI